MALSTRFNDKMTVEFNVSLPNDRLKRAAEANAIRRVLACNKVIFSVVMKVTTSTFTPPDGDTPVTEFCMVGRLRTDSDDLVDMFMDIARAMDEEAIAVYYPDAGYGEMIGPKCLNEEGGWDPAGMDWQFDLQYFTRFDDIDSAEPVRGAATA